MPNVNKKEIQNLLKNIKNNKIIIPKTKEYTHSLCGFYHSDLAKNCKKFLDQNQHKISLLFDKETKFVEFNDNKAFINLNFYEDYEKWINNE